MHLITIPMSHYCEKARWGLGHAGLDYVERAHLQGFHYLAVLFRHSQGKVPVLVEDNGRTIADSSEILHFVDARAPAGRSLYPQPHACTIDAMERRFGQGLGVETRRWVYFHWLQQPVDEILGIATQTIPDWQQRAAPGLFPMIKTFLGWYLGASADNVHRGREVILAEFDAVAERLEDGRAYLFGDRISAADISFACMAAPVLLPAEYGVRLPTLEKVPAQAKADVTFYRQHPAGQFALRLFRQDRRNFPTDQDEPKKPLLAA